MDGFDFHLCPSAPKTEVHFLGIVWSLWYLDPCSIAWQAVTEAQVVEQVVKQEQACWLSLPLLCLLWEAGQSL